MENSKKIRYTIGVAIEVVSLSVLSGRTAALSSSDKRFTQTLFPSCASLDSYKKIFFIKMNIKIYEGHAHLYKV